MPYISQADRKIIDNHLMSVCKLIGLCGSPGEVNYVITNILLAFLTNKPNYSDYNAMIGVLECVKMELYRRKIVEYEDGKIELNGDVY